jgi:hypothetical protein
MATLLDEIEVALTQKAAVEEEISKLTGPLQTKIKDLDGLILEKRTKLEEHLKRTKSDKVHSTDGRWSFTRSVRHDRMVSDPDAAKEWLKRNDLFERYVKLDLVGIKSLSTKREIDGVTVEEKEVFTLREKKEGEEAKPEETQAEFNARVRAARGEL